MGSIADQFLARDAWGMHTIVDLFDCDPDKLRDPDHIRAFLQDIVPRIGMRAYGEPIILRFGPTPRVEGISFLQLIETSLISGHCVEERNALCLDVFSCKEFDPALVVKVAVEWFGAQSYRDVTVFRGDLNG